MTEAGQKTILIVEDDADAVAALKLVLEREGYRVLSAPDAQKGMEAVHAERPNLILLDIMMPSGTEGFHFVWGLRQDADPHYRDIPILVLTAIHQTTALKLYPEQSDTTYAPYEYLPVQGFLDKPVAFDKLIEQVKSLVR